MDLWYPGAARNFSAPGCGGFIAGFAPRGVLHTTEGGSIAGALGAYRATGNYPHFTVDEHSIEQHCPINVGATALEHRSGTIDTNRAFCIQIELVGFAAQTPSAATLANVAPLLHWIEAQTGINHYFEPFTDANHVSRFSDNSWRNFNGWCGHQHVPNNAHWDPGALNVSLLTGGTPAPAPAVSPQPAPTPAPAPSPSNDPYSLEAIVAALPVIQQGASGQFARICQALIVANGRNITIDGNFGPASAAALKNWQAAVGITADGVCGPQTWRRLHCI